MEFELTKRLVVASNNSGKIKMIKGILKDYDVVSIGELNIFDDVEEDGKTFLENAIKKAEGIARKLEGEFCVADDSGIEIEYLDGFPGVNTKRWFDGTDRERNLALIDKLNGVEKKNRKVKFKVAMAISNGKETISEEAWLEGYISEYPRGENGFGFDEIFEMEDGRTLAELTFEEKNAIGLREEVLKKLLKKGIKE